MKTSTSFLIIWLLATLVGVLMSLNMMSAAYVDGNYIPVGNDSFYHARRMLDAAIGERGFYQFDEMIHVPEGSWLTWPWAYNYLAASALSLALLLNPALEPMAFLAYIPVAWLLVNFGLLTLIARQIGLQPSFAAIALMGFALLPLTQSLHGVGIVDHHFLELTFVLATVLTGLRFFSQAAEKNSAVAFGITLGIAPAFHNGLFVLQIPVLLALFGCWIGSQPTNKTHINFFAASLVGSTLAVLLPSGPFLDLQFEFWTLSWFHLYVSGCTAIFAIILNRLAFSRANFLKFVGIGAVISVPLLAKSIAGAAFLSGELLVLDQIAEVRRPFATLTEAGGLRWITSFYSWLFFLIPILIVAFARRTWSQRDPETIFLSVFVVFGLLMLLMQFRLHPFGSWAYLLCGLLLLQEAAREYDVTTFKAAAVALVVFALAFQPPIKNRLFQRYAPGNTADYAATRGIYPGLAQACSTEQGIAISYNDDGHYIRYHTECSVISNNFLISPQHGQKFAALDKLLQMNPEELLAAEPRVDFVLARMYGIFEIGPDGRQRPTPIPSLISQNAPLFIALTFAKELPPEYQLIDEVRVEDDRDFAYVRAFKIVRSEAETITQVPVASKIP